MNDRIEHHDCPAEIAERLKLAGGTNPYGEPMFRVVWGWNRIVKMTGEWGDNRAVETREVPKYLPGDRWFLEMWRPPSDYGSPERWGKLGEEVVGCMTVDTAGPFPHRGEYELCYPITSDLTEKGLFVPLSGMICELLVRLIKLSNQQRMKGAQREAAIRQRLERERQNRINRLTDELLDARPAFYDQPTSFSTGPKNHRIPTGFRETGGGLLIPN